MKSLNDLKEQLIIEKLFDDKRPIAGATDGEIELLRVNQNVKRLPQMYIEFARLMGNGSGYIFRESRSTCSSLIDVKSEFIKRFEDGFRNNQFELLQMHLYMRQVGNFLHIFEPILEKTILPFITIMPIFVKIP